MDFAEERKKKNEDLERAIITVFSYWVAASGRSAKRTLLARERKLKIRQRLVEQLGPMDERLNIILYGIDGCLSSSYHTEGGYTDIELICRNRSKLEAFAERTNGYNMDKVHPILRNGTGD